MATWPTTLPQSPLAGTTRHLIMPNKRSFQPERGTPIEGQYFNLPIFRIAATWRFSDAQREIFDSFWQGTIGCGALRYQQVYWVTGNQHWVKLVDYPEMEEVPLGYWNATSIMIFKKIP